MALQEWEGRPELLRSPSNDGHDQDQDQSRFSVSPMSLDSSPGTDLGSDKPLPGSPHRPADQPAGVESDDNFEVSDDADERQVSV